MLRLAVPVLVLALALVGAVLSDRPRPPADFTFINRTDPNTLDPQRMSWTQDFRVARLLYEGLVRNDPFSPGFGVEPAAAERWEVSEDGTVYTFHLRADAKWSNGEPVRAADFVYSWRRGMLPETASDYFKLFTLIRGAEEFYRWRTRQLAAFEEGADAADLWRRTLEKFEEVVGLRALDERTLRVELVRPVPYFLDVCAMAVFAPVYKPLVSRYEVVDPRTGRLDVRSGWTKAGVLVGSGPFELVTWRFRRDMRLERSEHYWDRASLNVGSIAVPSVEDPGLQVMAFTSGAADWVCDVTPPYRGDLVEAKLAYYREHAAEHERLRSQGLDPIEIDRRLPPDPRKNIHTFPAFGTYFFNINCKAQLADGRENPFADPRVRRAFALSLDKDRIASGVRRIGEPTASTLVPPGSIAGYQSPRGLGYDPDRARRELAAAGYPGGRNFPTVEVLFSRDGGHDLIAQAAAHDWRTQLGVRVVLAQKDVKIFRNDLKNHNYMISRAGWFGDYGDPTTFLGINRTGDGNNDRAYSSAAYDGLLDRAEMETDPAERMRLLSEAERILVEEDLPLIPVFSYSNVYLFDPHRVSGITSHPRQEQQLHRVDVLGDGKGSERPLALPPRPARGGAAARGGEAASGGGG